MKFNLDVLKKVEILCVEDEEIIREILKESLEKVCKKVYIAKDGQSALEIYEENKHNISIVLSDITMPVFDGLELVEKLREINSRLPIIMLTGHNENKYLLKAIELKVNAFIIKPINIATVFETVQSEVLPYFNFLELEQKNIIIQQQIFDLDFFKNSVYKYAIISKTNQSGAITEVNDRFCEVSEFTKSELIGKAHNIVRHPSSPKYLFKKMWEALQDGKTWNGFITNKTKSGKDYTVDGFIKPIFNMENQIVGFFSLRFDITQHTDEKRHLSKQLKESSENICYAEKMISEQYAKEIDKLRVEVENLQHQNSKLLLSLEIIEKKKERFKEVEDTKMRFKLETTIWELEQELLNAKAQVRLLTTAKINSDQKIAKLEEDLEKASFR